VKSGYFFGFRYMEAINGGFHVTKSWFRFVPFFTVFWGFFNLFFGGEVGEAQTRTSSTRKCKI